MDKDKVSLLDAQSPNAEVDECHSIGLEFLKSTSASSVLAARYVSMLQQLHGDHADESSIHDTNDTLNRARNQATEPKQSSSQHDPLGNMNEWNMDADLFSHIEMSFDDFNDSLLATGPSTDPFTFTGPAGDQFALSYVGW